MNILILVDHFSRGGAERQAYLLALELTRHTHTVEVWGFEEKDAPTPLFDELTNAGISCHQIPEFNNWHWTGIVGGRSIKAILKSCAHFLCDLLKFGKSLPKCKFDLVIPFTPRPSLFALIYQYRLGWPRVVWNHRGGDDPGGFPYTALLRLFVRHRASLLVANSSEGVKFLQRMFGFGAKTALIPNIVPGDALLIPEHLRSESTILHVANLYPEKDILTVIEAISILLSRGFFTQLIVLGRFISSNQQESILNRVRELGIEKQVNFIGELSLAQVSCQMSTATIGCLSTYSEGCPNALLEYMVHRLPIVATNIPSIIDILQEEQRRFTFPPGNPVACADVLQLLLADPALRARLASINFETVQSRFTSRSVYENWKLAIQGL